MAAERADVVRSITAGLLPAAREKAPMRKRAKGPAVQGDNEVPAKAGRHEPESDDPPEDDRDADGYQRLILFVGQVR